MDRDGETGKRKIRVVRVPGRVPSSLLEGSGMVWIWTRRKGKIISYSERLRPKLGQDTAEADGLYVADR